MKKTLLTVVAIGAVGGAVAGLLILGKKGDLLGSSAFAAADLVPQETALLIELPDLKGSSERWRQTSLYKIGQEPEVKAFLERPLSQVPNDATLVEFRTLCTQIGAEQAFVALTSFDPNKPILIGGLRHSGGEQGKQAIRSLVEKAKVKARESAPTGKAELEQYGGAEIESFSHKDITLAGAFAGDWYFLANDVALLKSAIDRTNGKGDGQGETPALSAVNGYAASVSRLPAKAELRAFVNFPKFRDQLIALSSMGGQELDAQQIEQFKQIEGVAFSTSFDGELIRDSLFISAPELKQYPTLTGATNGLTGPGASIHLSSVTSFEGQLPDGATLPGGFGAALQRLKAENIGPKELGAIFGPEVSFSSDIQAALTIPSNLFAIEVKDFAGAEKIVRILLEGWSKSEEAGVNTWSSAPIPAGALSLTANVALTDKLLLLGVENTGTNAAFIKTSLERLKSGAETLTESEAYKKALTTVRKPTQVAAYVDVKTIFERAYGMLRPMAVMAAAFSPQASEKVDLGKLPNIETISKHLHPSVMSQAQADGGIYLESTGTVTIYQALLGVGTTVGVAAQFAGPFLNQGSEAQPAATPDASQQGNP